MDEALQSHLAAVAAEVQAAAIPDTCKQTALWCLGRLPALYANLRLTSESRYGDEIANLVQVVLKELVQGKRASAQSEQLAAGLADRFRLLHEQWGLPGLALKAPRPAPARTRKVN